MTLTISLEPPSLTTDHSPDHSLFARPARLVDLDLASGDKVISTDDPDQDVGQRLRRLWHERGDFSALTADSINNPQQNDDHDETEQVDDRPSAQDMRELSSNLLEQLTLARGELHTALDLLSVLSEPTEPPSVEADALPLAQQSLILTHTATPPPPPSDPSENPLASLPLAISLNSIQKSANAFFAASDALMPQLDDDDGDDAPASPSTASAPARRKPGAAVSPWPTLLHLHAHTAHTLLPIGAKRGAALSGKGEASAAREVGVFFGCEESGVAFRRLAVARVDDLQGAGEEGRPKFAGRKLWLEIEVNGEVSGSTWDGGPAGGSGVEEALRERGSAMFAEELFASLSAETRSESILKASVTLGKRSTGDWIVLTGHNYKLTLTIIHSLPPPPIPASSGTNLASLLLPLTRLLFLQEFATRRQAHAASQPSTPHAGSAWSRPILASLGIVLAFVQRTRRIRAVLDGVAEAIRQEGVAVHVELFGGRVGEAVTKVLAGEKEVGARAVLRVGSAPERLFHVSYSVPLPHPPARMFTSTSATVVPSAAVATAAIPTLVLQAPGRAPFVVPSVEHLRLFLMEQVRG